jgi:glycosyltransferase involved in cell wall biosynthesis
MKILYLFRSLAVWGGIERILVDKMNWLASKGGVEVYMLTTDQGDHFIPYQVGNKVHIEDLGINFHRKYQFGYLKRMGISYHMRHKYKQSLSDRINRIQPDIIVCTTSDQIDIITDVKGRIPLVVESHSICNRTIEQGKYALLRYFRRFKFLSSLSKVDCVVALSEGDAEEWRYFHHNVIVIPNMLHPCKVEPSSLTSKRVIWVGRFDYQKRAEVAIDIWKQVADKFPDWCLDIYGDGEYESEVTIMASSMRNVFIHKPTSRIFNFYSNSSILISTSLFEPFGLVIAEAMSCGLPVVAFDCPYGPAAIISEGVNGFLIPFDNMQCFAEKLSLLIEDTSLRKQMGQAALDSSGRFNADLVMPQWMALFEELTKKHN